MAHFEIKNLSFTYHGAMEKTLESISLKVEQGDYLVLCGASGCGKTTLLRQLKPSVAPYGVTEGEILYNGIPLGKLEKYIAAEEIGFVFQNPDAQIVTDKVWHELAFGLENLGLDQAVIRARVGEMACYFGIQD